MESDPAKMSETEVQALAEAERDAGIPDQQTAAAAADAQTRQNPATESKAHPS